MKKFGVKIAIVILLTVGVVLGTNSCDDNSFINFHKIEIPEYSASDYLKLLDNKDNDIVYNAISNLVDEAEEYAQILSNDTITDTLDYNLAKDIYGKVSSHLKSEDEWVICAAIRFMTAFGSEYKNQDEIIEKLLGINKMTKSIQLEIMDGFAYTEAGKSKKYKEQVKRRITSFFNQKSWLLSRYAYPLTGNNDKLINKLIENYENTNEDFEKLLIIKTVADDFNDSTFVFLKRELVNSDDKKIRILIIKSLVNNQNPEPVADWISANYTAFEKDKEETFEYYQHKLESKVGSQIIITLIEHGFNPSTLLADKEPKLYQELFNKLQSYQDKKELKDDETIKLSNLKLVETAIENNQVCNAEWGEYKESHTVPEFSAEMLAKYRAQMAEVNMKTQKLFESYQIDIKYKDVFLEEIETLEKASIKK